MTSTRRDNLSPLQMAEVKDEKLQENIQNIEYKAVRKNVAIGKYICFTSFSPIKPKWDPETMDYLIFQREKTKEGRLHWQGYVEFKKTTRLLAAQSAVGDLTAHIERRKAPNGKLAADYCRKLDSAIPGTCEEFGDKSKSKGQGARSDLDAVVEMIKEGKTIEEIGREHTASYIKYHKGIEKALELFEPEVRPADPEIKLYPWQEAVITNLNSFKPSVNRRRIIWIWSIASKTGKSTFKKYLQFKYGPDQVMEGIFELKEYLYLYKKHKFTVLNIPRDHNMSENDFAVLEKISDGGVMLSTKYEPKRKLVDTQLIVFSNMPPPKERLPERFLEIDLNTDID